MNFVEIFSGLPSWGIYAGVGGCLGAIGAFFSWILEGAGHKWTRVLPVVAIACTGPVTREFVLPQIQSGVIESELADLPWMATIRDELPDEYKRILADFKAIRASSAADAEMAGFNIMVNFRRRHATDLANAMDENLIAYLQDFLSLTRNVRDGYGPELCAKFISDGASVLGDQKANTDVISNNVSILVRTIASSRRNPQPVGPATDNDWAAVAAKFLEAGGTDEQLQLVGTEQYSSSSYCNAALAFFQAVVDTPAPSGHRIRASLAKEMAGS
jgi:hypothetical protein